MSDIFEEVEESIRQDKATDLWKRYGIFVWIAGLLIIAGVAYWEWNRNQEASATEARIERFETARQDLSAGNYADAQEAFKLLADEDTTLSALAAHYLAQAYYAGNGDKAAAAEVLQKSSALEGPMQRVALLKSAYLRADDMDLTELESYLGDIRGENTALGALALELIAAKALKDGDLERARKDFGYLRFAPNAPTGVTQRAEIALSVIPEPVDTEVPEPDLDVVPEPEEDPVTPPAEQENEQ